MVPYKLKITVNKINSRRIDVVEINNFFIQFNFQNQILKEIIFNSKFILMPLLLCISTETFIPSNI